ncbi:MAG: hypothetical protein ABI779_02500 [Acidobacteriota bacterium]
MSRRIRWFVQIALAAVAGGAFRLLRRAFRRPPRIWHGFTPLHATAWMVQAERRAGFPSVSVVSGTRATSYALVRAEDFDRVFESDRWEDVHWIALTHLLLHGDIWNAYFDCLFFHPNDGRKNELALRLIRLAGIRIVVQPHGSDLVCLGKYKSRYDWPARMQLDYPGWDLAAHRTVVETRIDLFTRFAHFIVAGDILFEPVLPRWDISFNAVPADVESLQPSTRPPGEIPVVIHAPNHRHVKGTAYLLEALDRLRARGFPFVLRLIEGVPRHQALDLYAEADVIADQFIMGAFGIFALEGMSLGKPVLAYLDTEHLTRTQYIQPVVNATPENLEQVLAVMLSIPELRRRIGEASRASVVRHQSTVPIAEVWTRIYRHVWWAEPLDLETTAVFAPGRKPRAVTEDPRDAKFWPVEVADLMPQIEDALDRLS